MEPLEPLFEVDGLPRFEVPSELAELYGGPIGIASPQVVANFVTTVDGVVAMPTMAGSNRVIADGSAADRFVMGLLRACCDVVVIGSGTLAASPSSTWTPDRAYPDAREAYALLRAGLGRSALPELAVITGRGAIDVGHPALTQRSVILTTQTGCARLEGRLPATAEVVALGEGPQLDPVAILAALHARGHSLVLHEGGPHAIGPMFAAGLVDELFLTVSPLLVGELSAHPRLTLIEGTDLLAAGPLTGRILGVRRSGDHLFLRYGFDAAARRALG